MPLWIINSPRQSHSSNARTTAETPRTGRVRKSIFHELILLAVEKQFTPYQIITSIECLPSTHALDT